MVLRGWTDILFEGGPIHLQIIHTLLPGAVLYCHTPFQQVISYQEKKVMQDRCYFPVQESLISNFFFSQRPLIQQFFPLKQFPEKFEHYLDLSCDRSTFPILSQYSQIISWYKQGTLQQSQSLIWSSPSRYIGPGVEENFKVGGAAKDRIIAS